MTPGAGIILLFRLWRIIVQYLLLSTPHALALPSYITLLYFLVILICKLLSIKVPAKWININVMSMFWYLLEHYKSNYHFVHKSSKSLNITIQYRLKTTYNKKLPRDIAAKTKTKKSATNMTKPTPQTWLRPKVTNICLEVEGTIF